jgi:hypothetical protein
MRNLSHTAFLFSWTAHRRHDVIVTPTWTTLMV